MYEFISALVGIALSILMEYFPKFNVWYANLTPQYKKLVTLGVSVVGGLAVFGLACAGWLYKLLPTAPFSCTEDTIFELLKAIFLVLVGNQTTYTALFKKSSSEL